MFAAVMNLRTRRLIRALQLQGAVGVENAKPWSELNLPAAVFGSSQPARRLLRRGILVRTPQDRYYLDLAAYARFRASILQFACVMGALAVLVAVLYLKGLIVA
ncbi:MAG TPA: hypothetical protein PKE04_20340 [Clostridia bacterium]|nr:hypothetical protein [Clostridia bacterium]